jgi:hypothetical protein
MRLAPQINGEDCTVRLPVRRPFCWCFPPMVGACIISIVSVGILICDVRARWVIEAKVDTALRQNEALTVENAKLRGQMADAIKAVRDRR